MSQENNKLEAVKIGIGLSTQFIAAALGLLTLIGGVITFLLSTKDYGIPPVTFLVLGVLLLLSSIYSGFIGIAKARNNGSRGIWTLRVSQSYFDWQSIFGILGILSFAISISILLSTSPKKNELLTKIGENQESIQSILTTLHTRIQCDSLKTEVSRLRKEIFELNKSMNQMENISSSSKLK